MWRLFYGCKRVSKRVSAHVERGGGAVFQLQGQGIRGEWGQYPQEGPEVNGKNKCLTGEICFNLNFFTGRMYFVL